MNADGEEPDAEALLAVLVRSQPLHLAGLVAGNVAHEINNALNLVLGYTQLALEDEHLDGAVRSQLERVRTGSEQAEEATRLLMGLARRLRASQMQKVDVNALVGEVGALMRRSFERYEAMLLETLEEVPPVEIHPGQFQVVFLHLLESSLEALRECGGGIAQVRTEMRSGRVVVGVEDEAPAGSRLASPWLFVCQRIARDHGGELVVEPGEAGGLCATLELPASAD